MELPFLNKKRLINNRQEVIKIKILVLVLFGLLFAVWGSGVSADLIDELNDQIEEKQSKREELAKKAKEYQRVINKKQGEINSLNNQIAIFNARIGKLETEINITEEDLLQTELRILGLENGIDNAKTDIASQKDNLIQILQNIAEYDRVTELEMILKSKEFSDFFKILAQLENLQNSVQKKVDDLKNLKKTLSDNKQSKEEKKLRLEDLKLQLRSQQSSLANQKSSKESLLSYTRGEEVKYQKMLSRVQAQKQELLGDLNSLKLQKADELARLKKLQKKPPKEYWASSGWYYGQDDSRWAKTTIGATNSKLENYGCAISAVAMVFSYHGTWINPGQLAKKPIYYADLIVWPERWGNADLIYNSNHTGINWNRLDKELESGYPVIVFIKAYGRAGHYVVIHHKTEQGRYVVHDPLFGSNIYLSSSRAYIGELYGTSTELDQMIVYR